MLSLFITDMTERQLIKKLKRIGSIKPREKWVFSTKQRILGKEEIQFETNPSFGFFRKPALVFSSLLLIGVVMAGFFLYLNFQDSLPGLSQATPNNQNSQNSQNSEKDILFSLNKLQASLKDINLSLNSLRQNKDISKALAMAEVVKSTARQGEEIIRNIKNSHSTLPKKVLASLDNIAQTSEEVGDKSESMGKEFLVSYINDLKQRTLTPENEARLQKVEEYYNEGKIEEAMVLVLMIK